MATLLHGALDTPNNTPQITSRVLRILTMPKATADIETTLPDKDWLFDLSTTLQTTLDLEEMVRLFSEYTSTKVPHDSIEYANAAEEVEIRLGEPADNTCAYDVVLAGRNLGKMTFSRAAPFTEFHTVALENILCNLVHPLRNALLYRDALKAASKDPLTGLNNRASLPAVLERETELSRRHGTPLSLVMLDADWFKAVNDNHGHLVGDCALKALADCISSCSRDSDIVFRYGGEEFAVVLSNTGLDGAVFLAERIRKAVEEMVVRCHEITIRLTASLGVATLDKDQGYAQLLDKADEALYASKSRGRNRVTAPGTRVHPLPTRQPYGLRTTSEEG